MGFVAQLALVSETAELGSSELSAVAAAIQKQIARDLSRYWDVQGTMSAFARLEDVPPGYWPVIVKDNIEIDAAGAHCDHNGQPLALVTSGPGWSVTASHEALEMIVDPFGNRTVAGQSPKADQGRVEFLVEVADPVGDSTYTVNGITVADFITPQYFDPLQSIAVPYNYGGTIVGPRLLLPNGYITWHDPISNQWWQQSRFTSGQPTIVSIGTLLKSTCGMRGTVDRLAAKRRQHSKTKRRLRVKVTMDRRRHSDEKAFLALRESSLAKAELWRTLIRQLEK